MTDKLRTMDIPVEVRTMKWFLVEGVMRKKLGYPRRGVTQLMLALRRDEITVERAINMPNAELLLEKRVGESGIEKIDAAIGWIVANLK